MWIVKINGSDTSCHTQEADANTQKTLFIARGVNEADITIVEKENFEPPV